MEHKCFMSRFWLVLLISLYDTPLSYGVADTISGSKYITKGTSIVSSGGRFELGFFTPGKSSNYYIGIWYTNISPQTIVWVANRSKPIPAAKINSAKLAIVEGNLVLLNGAQDMVWSTNISSSDTRSSVVVAKLNEDGNLVLSYNHTETPVWQSFENPTHTSLPGSKFGYNKRTKTSVVFTSWKSVDDPAPGLYTHDMDSVASYLKWNGTEKYWSSGPFDGHKFRDEPHELFTAMLNSTYVNNENESYYVYSIQNPSFIIRHIVDIDGQQKTICWLNSTKEWKVFYNLPVQECDVYAYCGSFGICNQNSSSIFCSCLHGFKQRSEKDWGQNVFTGGCVRIANLQCGNMEEEDKFIEYPKIMLPRHPQNVTVGSAAECKSTCLRNCSCTAYAYNDTHGCSFWVGELFNLKQDDSGNTIYIRLAASEFSNSKDKNSKRLSSGKIKAIVASAVVVAASIICSLACVCYFKRNRITLQKAESGKEDGKGAIDIGQDNDEGIDVNLFSFESILLATDNFSDSNKLGKGGFGPVYKGNFPGGQETAIKRLGSHSGQGMNEFKNEVILIAKLQHRNLVKLLGYCMQAKEKILIYEYMPNKSLDTFIFDQTQRMLLDWNKRIDIILGIVRGLVYLHHDSRLRIIHRDLKTNNILLDEDLMPKISDFGLARIVEGKTTEANTKKIVGTYGYMSPEYALDGLFSIKSDVFSFGVVMLEIITGKNNTAFYEHEEVSNLLGYVWNSWNKGKAMCLVDELILQSCNESEVLKFINVGLLCVEEDPNNRPNMSNVLLMLSDENTVLPKPNQPAFVARSHTSVNSNTAQFDKPCSNGLTISEQEGR